MINLQTPVHIFNPRCNKRGVCGMVALKWMDRFRRGFFIWKPLSLLWFLAMFCKCRSSSERVVNSFPKWSKVFLACDYSIKCLPREFLVLACVLFAIVFFYLEYISKLSYFILLYIINSIIYMILKCWISNVLD